MDILVLSISPFTKRSKFHFSKNNYWDNLLITILLKIINYLSQRFFFKKKNWKSSRKMQGGCTIYVSRFSQLHICYDTFHLFIYLGCDSYTSSAIQVPTQYATTKFYREEDMLERRNYAWKSYPIQECISLNNFTLSSNYIDFPISIFLTGLSYDWIYIIRGVTHSKSQKKKKTYPSYYACTVNVRT